MITRFAAGGGDLSESLQLLFLRFREERGPLNWYRLKEVILKKLNMR